MKKRNVTPILSQRNDINRIPHPKIKKNSKIQTNRLILPKIKDKMEERNTKSVGKENNPNKKGSNHIKKNSFSIDCENKKDLSPINTEFNLKENRIPRFEVEKNTRYKLKLKGGSSRSLHNFKVNYEENSKEKVKRLIKNKECSFNKNTKKQNKNEGFLPVLKSGISNSKLKFPLIEQNFGEFKTDKKSNNKSLNHKNKIKTYSESLFVRKKFASHSRKGTDDNGKDKENNQDASIILNNVLEIENYCIYGIMDGHGSNGHLVSNFVKDKIEKYFTDKKIYKIKKLQKETSSIEISDTEKIYEKLKYNNFEIIRNFYSLVNDELYDTKFDVHFSGTTCVIVFKIGQKIICSNVGDSRAILVNTKNELNNNDLSNFNYDFIALSHDHKPNIKEERERIEKAGGEVAQEYLIGKEEVPVGPFRVWNKGCDYPGIAISRSLGDKIAELIGVIATPEILEFNIEEKSKYIIMGSDGLFDYLSNYDILDIAGSLLIKKNPDKACLAVIERAAEIFKEKEKRIDDITINIIIL